METHIHPSPRVRPGGFGLTPRAPGIRCPGRGWLDLEPWSWTDKPLATDHYQCYFGTFVSFFFGTRSNETGTHLFFYRVVYIPSPNIHFSSLRLRTQQTNNNSTFWGSFTILQKEKAKPTFLPQKRSPVGFGCGSRCGIGSFLG